MGDPSYETSNTLYHYAIFFQCGVMVGWDVQYVFSLKKEVKPGAENGQ